MKQMADTVVINNKVIASKILMGAAVFTAALFWFLSSTAPAVDAHGTNITYATTLTVQGAFESGEPMGNAEVSIFAPTDPENVWEAGIADAEGRYTFTPDINIEGDWAISYRSAGHGDIAYIPVGPSVSGGAAGGLTESLQRIVMIVSVIWGFVGTALYFQAKQGAALMTSKSD